MRTYLPADESSSRKNPLYNRIFDGLDKIDGKPTKAERKVSVLLMTLYAYLYSYSIMKLNL